MTRNAGEPELFAGDAVPFGGQRRRRGIDRGIREMAEHQHRRAGVDARLERHAVGSRPLLLRHPGRRDAGVRVAGSGAVTREVLERRQRLAALAAHGRVDSLRARRRLVPSARR